MPEANKFQPNTFTTSRRLDFCSEQGLRAQTGQPLEHWPLYVVKELVDDALDACEEAGVAPVVSVAVGDGKIVVTDNGPGIPADTVEALLDFSVRVSSREAYVSPTRGAQGNALKTIIAMPFVLDGSKGRVTIEAHGIAHDIEMSVDQVRQEPRLTHTCTASLVKNGTRITLLWPDQASSILASARDAVLTNGQGLHLSQPAPFPGLILEPH